MQDKEKTIVGHQPPPIKEVSKETVLVFNQFWVSSKSKVFLTKQISMYLHEILIAYFYLLDATVKTIYSIKHTG